ncbi:MAG TPA: helix-hairpin-helix domain-containing protein, partial [Clostridia bacterium]|nr:helix-hairpin-helix domain-containing protein [Clostridia bacterium]
ASFIRERYRATWQVPREILVESDLQDEELLVEFLRQQRGGAVSLRKPLRGQKKALIGMARHNAEKALERRARSHGSDPRALAQTLEYLGELTGMECAPRRLEAYDISHLGKGDRSGSMAVFVNGRPERASYRHFSIKGFEGIDDYLSMREVLTRRLERLSDERFGDRPDLILLDGGRGHVSACLPIAQEYGIPIAGMVKDSRHRTRGLVLQTGEIVELLTTSVTRDILENETQEDRANRLGLLHLLSAIQDEAHRFAHRHNERRRHSRATRYQLEMIQGVGPARRKKLIERFGSSKNIAKATLEELKAVAGIPEQVAQAIYNHFRADEADKEADLR